MISRKTVGAVLAGLVFTMGAWAEPKVALTLKGSDGLANKEVKSLVDKLGEIGYEPAGINENIQDAYFEKYHEKNLDNLSFYTITDTTAMRPLLLENPKFGAFSPFNLLVYKTLKENITWYGKLEPQAILDIIGEKDPKRSAAYTAMHHKLDAFIGKELKPVHTKTVDYAKLAKKPMLEMVKTFKRPDDISDFMDEFEDAYEGAFEDANFIIAGFYDFKETYTDGKLPFDKYDAYWAYSLCHFVFSNAIFNHGDPQAGVFAPCSVYFYIEKGSNKLHMGMATVENWMTMTGVTDPKKLAMMKDIDENIIKVMKKLGFEEEGAVQAVTPAAKVTPVAKKPQMHSAIKHGAKYQIGKRLEKVPTYLVAGLSSKDAVNAALQKAGFQVLSSTELLPGETVLSITDPTLQKAGGFASVINLLVNTKSGEVRVQNPDYFARAYLGKKYQQDMLKLTLQALQNALGDLYASEETLKSGDIAGYHFMMGMPYFEDQITLAKGSTLADKLKEKKEVLYTLKLADGSLLVGQTVGKRTRKFLKKIGVTHNACILPYRVLITADEARMLDPKFYLALSLPHLSMGEFMKIATIPDSIKKDLAKVYK